MKSKRLFDYFLSSCTLNPEKIYIAEYPNKSITYRECHERSIHLADILIKENTGKRPVLLNNGLSPISFMVSFWACMYCGQSIVLADNSLQDTERFYNTIEDILKINIGTTGQKPQAGSLPVSIYFQSSGTTGEPKLIQNTEKQFTDALDVIRHYPPMNYLDKCANAYITLPFVHSYGLSSILEYTLTAGTLYFPEENNILALIKVLQNKHIESIEGTPFFYSQLIPFLKRIELPFLKHIGFGADFVSSEIISTYFRRFNQIEITVRYGLTEIPSVISVQKIMNNQPQLAEGQISRISGWLSIYELFIEPDKSGELIVKYKDRDTIIKTGDYVSADPMSFQLKGRINSIFKHHGVRINPIEIEEKILESGQIEECRLFINDKALLTLEIKPNELYNEKIFSEYLKSSLKKEAFPELICQTDKIKRTYNGKIVRA